MSNSDSVVISGLGAITPLGPDCDTLLDGLKNAESSGKRLDETESPDGYYPLDLEYGTLIGAPVLETPPDDFMSSRKDNRLTRSDKFAVQAAHEALVDAGVELTDNDGGHFSPKKIDPSRIGVLIGSHFGGIQSFEQNFETFRSKGPRRVSPLTAPGMMPNRAAAEVSEIFGLQGPGFAPVAASASSSYSLGVALDILLQKRADIILAGGTEAVLTPFVLAAFSNLKATTRRNDDPQSASRPFDADRDGFLPAEGAGVVVLERKKHALERNVTPDAEFIGAGMNNDAHHITAPDPEGTGAKKAMEQAIRDAGLSPEDVDYLNAHGTSTPKNDPIETRAIRGAFGDVAEKLKISSTKSQLGHLLGADGAVETIATVLALRENFIPPTINYKTPDPECDLDYTPNVSVEASLDVALVNSFGFGGHNASLCLRSVEESEP